MARKSELPASKRVEAVLALLRKEDTGAQVARRYGVSEPTLYRWRDDFLAGGQAQRESKRGTSDALSKEVSQLRREIETREQVIGELAVANRMLKNAHGPVRLTQEVRAMINEARTAYEPAPAPAV